MLDHDPLFARRMLTSLAGRFERLLHDIETISLHTADERLVDYLLRQPREGDMTRLLFNKRIIASKLGLKPETLSRSLQHLSVVGLIAVNGARVQILDEAALKRMVPGMPARAGGLDEQAVKHEVDAAGVEVRQSGVDGKSFDASLGFPEAEGGGNAQPSTVGW